MMRTPLAALIVGALLVGTAGASGAWAQGAGGIDPDKAKDWLERTYGIASERVVEATPDELVTLRSLEARSPSDFHTIAHLESFRPADPLQPPSSDQEFFINCPSRRFHVERIESFSQNGARGAQSTSFGPTGWGRPVPNSTEERVVAAVCGPVTAEAAAPANPPPALRPATAPTPTPVPIQAPKPLTIPSIRSAPWSARELTVKPEVKPRVTRVQLFAGERQAALRFVAGAARRLPVVAGVGKPEIVEASSGGHPVFRVQVAGFASAADAARYCSAARSAGLECFVPPVR
jgi:hypothetical protein